jgi:hypothetical protein
MTMDPEKDVEVPGTHIGMAFNPAAYTVVAERLAKAQALSELLSPPFRARRLS